MLIFQQPVPIKAIFARIRGIQSFWPRHISSMMYKGPKAAWRAMATQKQPQKMKFLYHGVKFALNGNNVFFLIFAKSLRLNE